MKMRHDLVRQHQKPGADQKADGRFQPGRAAVGRRQFQSGIDQRKETGADHDAGCETEHCIEHLRLDLTEEKHHSGSERRHEPGEQSCI